MKENKDNYKFKKGGEKLKCSQVTKLLMVAFAECVITASVLLDYICSLWK